VTATQVGLDLLTHGARLPGPHGVSGPQATPPRVEGVMCVFEATASAPPADGRMVTGPGSTGTEE
jgi:hypothetical protein